MESYGEILKEAREAKNLDFDIVARETSINKSFIQGLEQEDDSAFPGEPYMLGFLRNYSDYLGTNTENLLQLYRNKKLQESPIPENLIVHKKSVLFWIAISAGALAVICGIVFLVIFLFTSKKDEKTVVVGPGEALKQYVLEENLNHRFYVGDQIVCPTSSGNVILTVVETLSSLGLQCPVGTIYMELAEELAIDVDGDSANDIIVYVSDISKTNSTNGAEVRIIKSQGGSSISSAAVIQSDIPMASDIVGKKKTVIVEDNRAYPFTLEGTFRGSCLFRYKVDRRDSNESYFATGEVVTMTANNGVRLWMSNSNAIKFTITADTKEYNFAFGKAGQILVQDIKWIKDTDGKYKLVVIELD